MNEEEKNEQQPRTGAKPKPRKKKWAIGIFILILLLGVLGGVIAVQDIHGRSGSGTICVVEIPQGFGTAAVAEALEKEGVIRSSWLFRLYVRSQDTTPVYQRGKHTVSPSMGYDKLLAKLETPPDVIDDQTIKMTIPEGYELRQIVDELVAKGLGNKETYMEEIQHGSFNYAFVDEIPDRENRLEGYLYPETYLIDPTETEHEILDRMLRTFQEKVLPVYEAASTDYTLDEIVTLASVIEREAASDEERPLVASVFYNRLGEGMKLESCATVQYILKERKAILSHEDTSIASPYNTYQNQGLPVGPIASPGLNSIKAALQPAETDYFYFVANEDGSKNLFSESFEDHNQKTREVQGSKATEPQEGQNKNDMETLEEAL